MRRVLIISGHFPPDSSAGAHRVRLLAPHLREAGWDPVVLTLTPESYETRLDEELARMVPKELRVERVQAWGVGWTRKWGIGDLGLRSLVGLKRKARELLSQEKFDMLFITIYPSYPAALGPSLSAEFKLPFVLDYQDPWVGSWGLNVGGGQGGKPDLKSRLTRWIAGKLEPKTLRSVAGVTAVSEGTYAEIFQRNPSLRGIPVLALPLGLEPLDFEYLRHHPRKNRWFEPKDGLVHFCYVGTLLPLGFETLRALFAAAALVRKQAPSVFRKIRFHFFGTSNQSMGNTPARVIPIAREFDLQEVVSEEPRRISYLDALTVQTQASVIVLLGSSEPHYTASKIYPALLSQRPILALYHEASSVVDVMRAATSAPTVQMITYGPRCPVNMRQEEIADALAQFSEKPNYQPENVDTSILRNVSTRNLAAKLGVFFDRVYAASNHGK